jgi:hypothetical protein
LKVHHILSRQHYGRRFLCAKRDRRYADCGSHCVLQTESSNAVMMV